MATKTLAATFNFRAILCRRASPLSLCSSDISTTSPSTAPTTTTAAAVSERMVPLDSARLDIHIVETAGSSIANGEGRAPKHTVLLMPGALGTGWTDFRPQLERLPALLPADWSLIAWDPPGYGKSRPPQRTFPVDFFRRDATIAAELMATLGRQRYSVLGWSDGGITGMLLAAQQPQAVERLVVWGANSYVLPQELQIYEGIRDVRKWSPKMRQPLEDIYGAEGFARLWSDWIDGFHAIARCSADGDICREALPQIRCATLIVHGAKDPMIAAEHVPYLRQHIARTEYVEFAEGKHNVHLRYADEFNRAVAAFLQRPQVI